MHHADDDDEDNAGVRKASRVRKKPIAEERGSKQRETVSKQRETVSPATPMGQTVVCVRTCDGYFFPLGQATDTGALNAQGSLCTALCPNAKAELYLIPPGADGIETATSLEGHSYSKMHGALRYTKGVSQACTCRKPGAGQATLVSLLKDFTLRRGDAVMTARGVMVFKGAWRWPYKTADFLLLDKAKSYLTNAVALAAMEKAAKWLQERVPRATKSREEKTLASSFTYITDGTGKKVRLIGDNQSYPASSANELPDTPFAGVDKADASGEASVPSPAAAVAPQSVGR